uniref:Uncharacterized protein n=1 Tax=Romanomermis culicivorax TaxID=13658 RepID=A0A915KII3_ROMCU
MGVKRKAPGHDRPQADKYQRTAAKSSSTFKTQKLQCSSSTGSGPAQRQQGRDDMFSNLATIQG